MSARRSTQVHFEMKSGIREATPRINVVQANRCRNAEHATEKRGGNLEGGGAGRH